MSLRPCPTCGRLYPDGNCPTHARPAQDRQRARTRRHTNPTHYGRPWRRLRAAVLTDPTCAYCHQHAGTVDLPRPLSRGGQPTADNALPCCSTCNTSKGGRGLAEWVGSGCAPPGAVVVLRQRQDDGLPT